jgi:hypothetical protein
MAKMVIRDDCFSPDRYIRIKYSGPNPWGISEFLASNLKQLFHVSSSKVSNYRINWDISGDPISFYSRWWVRKEIGRWTKMRFMIKFRGEKSKSDNTGKFSMTYHARVITEVGGWGPLMKTVWTLYSYLFYNRIRRKYIEQCRNYMLNLRNMIKEHFNIETTEVPTSRGF